MERDFTVEFSITSLSNFNSHAHVERDQRLMLLWIRIFYFNSHAHVERDWQRTHLILCPTISTHTLTWSVTLSIFSPEYLSTISTHTLTWSVTMINGMCNIGFFISTHTLTWSVTWEHWYNFWRYNNFNSHAHVERDKTLLTCDNCFTDFNSHAHVERD